MNLSPREKQIVALLAEGNGTKQIAVQLELSLWTIQTYRQQIYEKLELPQNSIALRTQWVLAARLIRNRFA